LARGEKKSSKGGNLREGNRRKEKNTKKKKNKKKKREKQKPLNDVFVGSGGEGK